MIRSEAFLAAARERGFRLWSGVPCSYLEPFINSVISCGDLRYVAAANEGDAVAIGAGAELGGVKSVVLFQNSGLGNAVNPLTSLTHTLRLPVLLIPSLRGEPGGPPDEPQHELMGAITTRLLELVEIPWEYFPREEADVAPALDRAVAHMREHHRPYALVMRAGSVEPVHESAPLAVHTMPRVVASGPAAEPTLTRTEALRAVQDAIGDEDVVVATTGYTGRELFALDDRPNQLYMVGSMGCASSLGLGLALARPDRRVVVLDGDGALLMRLGALATVGYERPANLVHVVLDNGVHESTGGQSTVSRSIDFCALARACGFPASARADTAEALTQQLQPARAELSFVHVTLQPGTPAGLPRPDLAPHQVALRLRRFLGVRP